MDDRRHFEEMASHFNVPEEKLAENVLRGSLTDQLLMLAEFYKSKDKNTEAVFTPLVEEALKTGPNEQTNKSTNSNKSVPNDRTPEKSIRIVVSPKRKSKTRETAQTDHNQPSNSKQQQKKKNVLVIEESR